MLVEALQELMVILRNNVTDPLLRGTDTSEDLTATPGQTAFTLSSSNRPVNNVQEVTVDGQPKVENIHFTVAYGDNITAAVITFLTAMTGGEIVHVEYHYNGTMIYPDFPRLDSQMPRLSVAQITSKAEDSGMAKGYIGNSLKAKLFTIFFQVDVWSNSTKEKNVLADEIILALWNKRHGGIFIDIEPMTMSDQDLYERADKRICRKVMQFRCLLEKRVNL